MGLRSHAAQTWTESGVAHPPSPSGASQAVDEVDIVRTSPAGRPASRRSSARQPSAAGRRAPLPGRREESLRTPSPARGVVAHCRSPARLAALAAGQGEREDEGNQHERRFMVATIGVRCMTPETRTSVRDPLRPPRASRTSVSARRCAHAASTRASSALSRCARGARRSARPEPPARGRHTCRRTRDRRRGSP
jgi:hypothetical protein